MGLLALPFLCLIIQIRSIISHFFYLLMAATQACIQLSKQPQCNSAFAGKWMPPFSISNSPWWSFVF